MYCVKVCGNTYATNILVFSLVTKKVVRLLCGAKRLDHTSTGVGYFIIFAFLKYQILWS